MVSIAMATYNGSKYIKEQIDSILSQTYRDIELVVTDDCSTDNTLEILKSYEKQDSRVHAYANENNLGFAKNFEKAISLCKGDYIALSDQDDIWASNHIEELIENIADKLVVWGMPEMIDGSGTSFGFTLGYRDALDVIPEDLIDRVMSVIYFRNPYQGASMMFKREFLDYALPIPEGIYHDTWFIILACFVGGFYYVDNIIGYYRMHEHNVSAGNGKRVSRIKMWYYLGRHGLKGDRLPGINAILSRNIPLTNEQKKFLKEAKRRFTKQSGLKRPLQKLSNWIFITKHYKTIFSIK